MKTTNNRLAKRLVFLGVVMMGFFLFSNKAIAQNTLFVRNGTPLALNLEVKQTDPNCISIGYITSTVTIPANSVATFGYLTLWGNWDWIAGGVELVSAIPATNYDLCNWGVIPITGGGYTIDFSPIGSANDGWIYAH